MVTLEPILLCPDTICPMHSSSVFDNTNEITDQRPRVLVVEDNLVNQRLTLAMVSRMGWHADLAVNGLDAIAALEKKNYGVVLMDVQMPEMDGLTATKEIRSRFPAENQPAIIALTANTLPGDREECLLAGMDDYIGKPFDPANLAEKLAHWSAAYVAAGRENHLHPFATGACLQPA